MSKVVDLKFAGLWTAPNDYTVPDGACDVAENVVNDQKNLAQPRAGFETYIDNSAKALAGYSLLTLTSTDPFSSTYDLLTYRFNSGSNDGVLLLNDDDTITGEKDFLPPANAERPRMINWGQYIFVTSSQGIKSYSIGDNASVAAGIPQGLDVSLSLTGASGFFSSNSQGTITASRTNASPTLTIISSTDIANVRVGQFLTGTGIASGTTVSAISLSVSVAVHACDLTSGNTTIVSPTNGGIAAGQIVSGSGFQPNTRVVSIAGAGPYNIVVTIAPIFTDTGVQTTFSSDNTITMSANATSGAATPTTVTLGDGAQVAYRVVWGLVDDNKQVLVGAPSAFSAIVNTTGGTRDVIVNTTIPEGITTDHFYQVYRSRESVSASVPPADQMQLVIEGNPTGTDITNGFIQVTDQTPDSLKGEALYTGTDVEGIGQANYRPPTATDMCVFRGHTLYFDITQPLQLKLIIDGVGAPSGVQVGDIITIDDALNPFSLEAAAAEDIAAGEFRVFTSGTPAQNIADTAASFIKVLNRTPLNTLCYAHLLSGPNDLPGQILLEARSGILSLAVDASANGTAWTPNIDAPQVAEAENIPNGIGVSKFQQLQAVPRLNVIRAGAVGVRILRGIPLRDFVVVWTNQGIYRLTGQSAADFQVEPFDLTTTLVAPESATTLGNEAWGLSNQGVVSVSDGGVRVRSGLQINSDIQRLVLQAPNALRDFGFAVGHESQQRFILSVPTADADTTARQQYCYNYIQETWTTWDRNTTAGYVHPIDGLFFGNGNNTNVVKQRNEGNFTDYVDESIPVLISAASGTSITLNTVVGVTVGDVLWQNQSGTEISAEIISVDPLTNVVVLAQSFTWNIGGSPSNTAVLTAIETTIQWKPVDAGDPTEVKQHSEGQLIFRGARFNSAQISFSTDISTGFDSVSISGLVGGGWGFFTWGNGVWGGGEQRPRTFRFYVPQDKQYGGIIVPKLMIRSGYADWGLQGMSISLFDIGPELGGPGPGSDS